MRQAVQRHPGESPGGLEDRLLRQAGRELMLAQSSDWPFIITNGTTEEYARRRFHDHVHRFHDLLGGLDRREIDAAQAGGAGTHGRAVPGAGLSAVRVGGVSTPFERGDGLRRPICSYSRGESHGPASPVGPWLMIFRPMGRRSRYHPAGCSSPRRSGCPIARAQEENRHGSRPIPEIVDGLPNLCGADAQVRGSHARPRPRLPAGNQPAPRPPASRLRHRPAHAAAADPGRRRRPAHRRHSSATSTS